MECSVRRGYYLFPQCHFVLPRVLPVTGLVFLSVVPHDADFRFSRFPRVLPLFFSSCGHPSEPLFFPYCVTLAILRSLCLPRPLCTTVDHGKLITSSLDCAKLRSTHDNRGQTRHRRRT